MTEGSSREETQKAQKVLHRSFASFVLFRGDSTALQWLCFFLLCDLCVLCGKISGCFQLSVFSVSAFVVSVVRGYRRGLLNPRLLSAIPPGCRSSQGCLFLILILLLILISSFPRRG